LPWFSASGAASANAEMPIRQQQAAEIMPSAILWARVSFSDLQP
jgi:hypothetical protein